MVLARGFSGVDEGGKIAVPCNILFAARIIPGCRIEVEVVRFKGSARRPYVLVHEAGTSARLSTLEAVVLAGEGRLGEDGRVVLSGRLLGAARFVPGDSVELKLRGPQEEPGIVIRNRGIRLVTTLQQRLGRVRDIRQAPGDRLQVGHQ